MVGGAVSGSCESRTLSVVRLPGRFARVFPEVRLGRVGRVFAPGVRRALGDATGARVGAQRRKVGRTSAGRREVGETLVACFAAHFVRVFPEVRVGSVGSVAVPRGRRTWGDALRARRGGAQKRKKVGRASAGRREVGETLVSRFAAHFVCFVPAARVESAGSAAVPRGRRTRGDALRARRGGVGFAGRARRAVGEGAPVAVGVLTVCPAERLSVPPCWRARRTGLPGRRSVWVIHVGHVCRWCARKP